MKNYAQRRHDWAKHTRRRYNYFYGAETFWSRDTPSYTFLCLDTRLLILFFVYRACQFRQRLRWCGYQHGCSCWLCRSNKRKFVGNSFQGKPIQEVRQHLALLED